MRGDMCVASIVDRTRENRLRWLGHVSGRGWTEAVRLVNQIYVEGNRGRGRPGKRCLNVIECDMKSAGVSVEDAGDRVGWKLRTRVAGRLQIVGREEKKKRRTQ